MRTPRFQQGNLEANLSLVEALRALAESKGVSVAQIVIAWVLAQDGIDAAIVGARSDKNIERSLAAVDVELSGEDLAEIEKLTADGIQVSGASPEGVA